MAKSTKIEWTDATFNPWIGCTQVSPACDHCYAAVSTPARTRSVEWGSGKRRQRTGPANWALPRRWNAKQFYECAQCGWRGDDPEGMCCPTCRNLDGIIREARRRVFCASLADWLDNEVPAEWLADLLSLIASTPNLDWLLLTKRIGNWRTRLQAAVDCFEHRLIAGRGDNAGYAMARNWLLGDAPAHVWVGATICNQPEADRDITKLLRVPAAVRFLSIEPMLGPVDLTQVMRSEHESGWTFCDNVLTGFRAHKCGGSTNPSNAVDWVIVGGESGPHARPMHPDWVRSLRDQCAEAGVAFFMKQMGGVRDKRGKVEDLPDDLRIREFPR